MIVYLSKHPPNTLSRGEDGPKGRERNGGRTDIGIGLLRCTTRRIAARIPHPPQCAHWGTFPPGEGIGCGGFR